LLLSTDCWSLALCEAISCLLCLPADTHRAKFQFVGIALSDFVTLSATCLQDALTVQLVVTFLRNLLAMPDVIATAGSRGDHKTRARGELLQRLLEGHALELLLIVAQHTDEARCSCCQR